MTDREQMRDAASEILENWGCSSLWELNHLVVRKLENDLWLFVRLHDGTVQRDLSEVTVDDVQSLVLCDDRDVLHEYRLDRPAANRAVDWGSFAHDACWHCECGEATGEYCTGTYALAVDWVPEFQRGTATAAGSWQGLTKRLHVSRACADMLIATGWAEEVER